ncbi:MAG: hypothetical protein Q8880_07025 [Bacteroidota bacterium]|nr:hypothetical protein [Bacteroidota bacterium]
MRILLSAILSFFSFVYLYSQQSDQGNREDFFLLSKIGRGIPYGGYGINLESGIKNISGYITLGYETSRARIPESHNYGIGIRYYDNVNDYFNTRYGINIGWVNNYFDERLDTISYNSNVYGASIMLGGEFFTNFFLFDFDITLSPSFLIFNPDSHPYYRNYIALSAGLGFNLGVIKFKGKKKNIIEKKEIPQIN